LKNQSLNFSYEESLNDLEQGQFDTKNQNIHLKKSTNAPSPEVNELKSG
jgi:hypothetical protein